MSFRFAPARREKISLLIALAGASGSGKTLSALRLARGLCRGDDAKIAVIDTEAGRALHYAVAQNEQTGPDRYAFQHGDLKPPFTPEAYIEAIAAADAAGFAVVVVDSVSHEYEGDGGLHALHDEIVARGVEAARAQAAEKGWSFNESAARERLSIGAWNEPKTRHKRFVSRLLQCRAHLILCLRAEEKLRIEQVKDERTGRSRMVITQAKDLPPAERWVPICEKRFMYEMTLSLLLSPANPGVPIPIKLQSQHRPAILTSAPLSETSGAALADWATGTATESGAASPNSPHPDDGAGPTCEQTAVWDKQLADAAEEGMGALEQEWQHLPHKEARIALRSALDRRHKPRARAVDAERTGQKEEDPCPGASLHAPP